MIQEPQPLPSDCPFWSRAATLGRASDFRFAKTVAGKLEMLRAAPWEERFFVAWTGQHSTDLFVLTPADVGRLLSEKSGPR